LKTKKKKNIVIRRGWNNFIFIDFAWGLFLLCGNKGLKYDSNLMIDWKESLKGIVGCKVGLWMTLFSFFSRDNVSLNEPRMRKPFAHWLGIIQIYFCEGSPVSVLNVWYC
jgi:hypothetical protein